MPDRLYKYEAFSEQSLQNLKNQVVYFGSPAGFNDPYDCAGSFQVALPTESEAEALRNHLVENAVQSDIDPESVRQMPSDMLAQQIQGIAKMLLSEAAQTFRSTRGVTCFSELNNDLLMWAHYGGCYQGFCLEFDTGYEPFSKARRVEYVPKIPTVNATEIIMGDASNFISTAYCTKSESWAYEHEWRCIHEEGGMPYGYEADALLGIYFGPDIELTSLEIACLILQGQNPNIRFWRGSLSDEEFKVTYKEFTYTPYAEAKLRGLIT